MYNEEENIALCYLRVTALVLAAKSRAEAVSVYTNKRLNGLKKLKLENRS